jgi:hypothetical protein
MRKDHHIAESRRRHLGDPYPHPRILQREHGRGVAGLSESRSRNASAVLVQSGPDLGDRVGGNEIGGDLLQVMPWPTFSHMSDNDKQAIYEYLRAVPCNANSKSPYPWVRNVC